jgi:hypothetical protein
MGSLLVRGLGCNTGRAPTQTISRNVRVNQQFEHCSNRSTTASCISTLKLYRRQNIDCMCAWQNAATASPALSHLALGDGDGLALGEGLGLQSKQAHTQMCALFHHEYDGKLHQYTRTSGKMRQCLCEGDRLQTG